MAVETLRCEILVIGSGPGGATSAALLGEAGKDVILLEEGPHLSLDSAPPYSLDEMTQKWRNGGLTPTFGQTRVTYIESRCVGGASEINAALYHQPLPEVLSTWGQKYGIDDIGTAALAPHVKEVETTFSVSKRPDGVGRASEHLYKSAQRMGWKASELARFWKYTQEPDGKWKGRRQSMTEVMIPRALRAGVRLFAETRVDRLELDGDRAVAAIGKRQGKPIRIEFDKVFLCAGAIQSPLILRRSGITKNVGNSLTMNPMIRIAAAFDQPVNDPTLGVPVHQVEQFKPLMTLGCSHSGQAHLALWLAGMREGRDEALERWPYMTIYYVKIGGSGRGRVRSIPVTGDAFVHYPIADQDLRHLGQGLMRLGEMLIAGGAKFFYDPMRPGEKLSSMADMKRFENGVPKGNGALSAIHLHSTVPMGRPEAGGATDSWGKLHGYRNIQVNDSSILPDTPGINPQGLILAIAHRNLRKFLG